MNQNASSQRDFRRKSKQRSGSSHRERRAALSENLWIFGHHAVAAALANPRRDILRIVATKNALDRLGEGLLAGKPTAEEGTPKDLDRLLGTDAVHQGVAVEVAPLPALGLDDIAGADLIVVLDQVTDPHNVGAIFRSAAAFGAGGIVTTERHAPAETGVLAKAASGALEMVPLVVVGNLARSLTDLADLGFFRIGLDSEAATTLEAAAPSGKVALVLGAEGKGLRRLTRDTCDTTVRLDMPGPIKSLNVSNAAAVSLYIARAAIDAAKR